MLNTKTNDAAAVLQKKSYQPFKSLPFYLFISPWLFGFFGLTVLPMLFSLYASFTKWDGISSPVYIGLENYRTMFGEDDRFYISIRNTMYYAFCAVPASQLFALFLAAMLKKSFAGRYFFRTVFYLPSVVSGVATYLVWRWMFDTNIGVFNYILSFLGIQGPSWLLDTKWAMPSLIIMSLSFCGGAMLIFLAGLQNIPEQLYEAAKIDGASPIKQFIHVTIPMLSPVIFFNLIMGIIDSFQVFAQPWIMTEGGPIDATYVYGIHIYNSAFKYFTFGYASALAWVLFLVIMVISLLFLLSAKKWVHYEGG
jgi:multiple sugar transport system permease protein